MSVSLQHTARPKDECHISLTGNKSIAFNISFRSLCEKYVAFVQEKNTIPQLSQAKDLSQSFLNLSRGQPKIAWNASLVGTYTQTANALTAAYLKKWFAVGGGHAFWTGQLDHFS